MNVENILKTANAIEKGSVKRLGFNMETWIDFQDDNRWYSGDMSGHQCKTTACIAGWAMHVKQGRANAIGKRTWENISGSSEFGEMIPMGADFFEIEYSVASVLFTEGPPDTTPAEAVALLRSFAETGVVEWDKFAERTEDEYDDK